MRDDTLVAPKLVRTDVRSPTLRDRGAVEVHCAPDVKTCVDSRAVGLEMQVLLRVVNETRICDLVPRPQRQPARV